RLVVPPHHWMTAQTHGIDDSGAKLLAERQLGNLEQRQVVPPACRTNGLQMVRDRRRSIGLRPRDRHHLIVGWWVEIAVVKDRARRIAYVLEENLLVLTRRQRADIALDADVVDELERRLDDHPEAAVAADRAVEEVGVLGRARRDERAVGEH